MPARQTSFLFDLDGTLVDSVYQHVLAWHEALEAEGIELSIWRIHRRIGMSGGLFTNMLLRETGIAIDPARIERLRQLHAEAYNRRSTQSAPLPGRARAARLPDASAGSRGRSPPAAASRPPDPSLENARRRPRSRVRSSRATRCSTPSPTPTCSSPPPRRSACRSKAPRRRRQRLGHARRPRAPARSASACSRAATARTSWCAPAPTASTKIPADLLEAHRRGRRQAVAR